MDVSDIFYFWAKGESEAPGGGGRIAFTENSRRGGGSRRGRVRAGVSSANYWGDFFFGGGGGLNIFFRGRNVHQVMLRHGRPEDRGSNLGVVSRVVLGLS